MCSVQVALIVHCTAMQFLSDLVITSSLRNQLVIIMLSYFSLVVCRSGHMSGKVNKGPRTVLMKD